MTSEATFLRHTSCPTCGSSDGNSEYSDGHYFCFVCQTYTKGERRVTPISQNLIQDLRPINKLTRGIREETFSKFNYCYGTYRGATVHVAPFYFKGKLVAQKIRTKDKDFYWVGEAKNIELFGQHLWKNSGDYRKRIIITEGEIDCLSVSQAFSNKWPVVSIPSGAQSAAKYLKQQLEFLEGYEEIVLGFDNDEPGRKATEECCQLFSPGKVKVADWSPYKDANEMLQDGKAYEITQRVFDAKQYRPDGIVAAEDLWEVVNTPPEKGYDIQYPKLNGMLQGLRKGELVMFTAGSGIGKSTIVHEIGYYLKQQYGLKIGVIALEENVKRTIERYMSIYLEKPLHISREGFSEEDLKVAFDVASQNLWLYDHWGSLETSRLLSKLRYMVKALGVDFIILDHISIVVSGLEDAGQDERKDIDRLMTNLRSLAEETNVGILGVVHLKRKEQGKSFNEGRQVSLSDLRGSGSLEQLSDAVVALERDQQGDSPNRSTIRVLKNRFTGVTGQADELDYSPTSGRLLAVSGFENEETEKDNEEEVPF